MDRYRRVVMVWFLPSQRSQQKVTVSSTNAVRHTELEFSCIACIKTSESVRAREGEAADDRKRPWNHAYDNYDMKRYLFSNRYDA